MELSFETKSLREACENKDFADLEYGKSVGMKLRTRLADLVAAQTVQDIIAGNPLEISGMPHPEFKIDLCDGYVLTFTSNHRFQPAEANIINWGKVSRIRILSIGKI